MKVYVCYEGVNCWDCNIPVVIDKVVTSEVEAQEYMSKSSYRDYEEFEIEGTTDNENCT